MSPCDVLHIGKDEAPKEAVAVPPSAADCLIETVEVLDFVDIDLTASLILCRYTKCQTRLTCWSRSMN